MAKVVVKNRKGETAKFDIVRQDFYLHSAQRNRDSVSLAQAMVELTDDLPRGNIGSAPRGYEPSRSIANESVATTPNQLEPDVASVDYNGSGYGRSGSSNWEHDDTGSQGNYAGCYDMTMDAASMHEGWEAGYDY